MTAPRRNPNWAMPTAPAGTSDSRGASTAFVTQGGSGPRKVLSTATSFFIANNGSDANDGSTSATPLLTFAAFKSLLLSRIDTGGQNITLQAVTGQASFTSTLDIAPWVGGGNMTCDLAGGSIAVTNGNAIQAATAPCPGNITVQQVSLSTSGSGDCLAIFRGSNCTIGPGVSFGTASQNHIDAEAYGTIRASADYSITGPAQSHWVADTFGAVAIFGRKITISNSPTFTYFANCQNNAAMTVPGNTFTTSSGTTGTGTRFNIVANSVINTQNAGANYLPGNAAGTTSAGGQYL